MTDVQKVIEELGELTYKGYMAKLEYDEGEKVYFGDVVGIKDFIGFASKTPEKIETKFHQSVDAYLKFCQDKGMEPEKPGKDQKIE